MKEFLTFVFFLTFAVPRADSESLQCINPWVKVHRACYKFVKEYVTWDDATNQCLEDGANLASIGSMSEKRKIMKHLTTIITKPNEDKWWVGLRHNQSRSVWRWSDGAELNTRVTRWSPGEPNNGRGNEYCAEFRIRGNLNDAPCSNYRYYICERIKITPAPTTSTTSKALTTTQIHTTTTTTTVATTTATTSTTTLSTTTTAASTPTTSNRNDFTSEPVKMVTTPRQKGSYRTEITKSPQPIQKHDQITDTSTQVPIKRQTTATTTSPSKISPTAGNKFDTRMPAVKTHCRRVEAYGLVWPATKKGKTRSVKCAGTDEMATWRCSRNPPVRWVREPDTSACASKDFKNLITRLTPEISDNSPLKTEDALDVASDLVKETSMSKPMTVSDIWVSTKILKQVTNVRPKTRTQTASLVKNLIKAGSNLIKKTDISSEVARTDKRRAASNILSAMEESTKTMADTLDVPTVIKTVSENIKLELYVINTTDTSEALVCGDGSEEDKVSIPAAVLRKLSTDDLSKVVFMKHSDIGEFLVTENESSPAPTIASDIISVSIGNGETNQLPEPVTFSLNLLQPLNDQSVPLCSFWNFSEGDTGKWSQDGCFVSESSFNRVECKCDHLTSFAVLLDVTGVAIASHHESALKYITYVGCIISLISLFTSWLTFNCLSPLQSDRNTIHKNLVFCLFVAELVFLIGIDQTHNKVACAVVALLLHFFFLSAFTWMLMEAVQMVVMLVQVFDTTRQKLKYYYLAGYGVPVVIVSTTAGIDFTAYGTTHYCWLTTDRYFIWSFAGPVACILVVNAGILTYAMSTVCRHADYVFSREKATSGNFKAWIQGAFALEVLLGLTWIFGYFFINEETISLAYIFTILNSLQGLFIFVFHCMLNKKVRNEYKKLVHLSKKAPAVSTTKSASLRKNDASYEL